MAAASRFHSLNRRRGATGQALIEYVVYIGLAALVLAGLIYFATKGRAQATVQNEVTVLTDEVAGAQKLYNSDPNGYASVTAKVLIDNGIVPASVIRGSNMSSNFGTPVTVSPSTLYTTNDGIAFDYLVQPSNCSSFVKGVSSLFAKITVNGTVLSDQTSGKVLSPSTLGTQCSGTGGGNVTVTLVATR